MPDYGREAVCHESGFEGYKFGYMVTLTLMLPHEVDDIICLKSCNFCFCDVVSVLWCITWTEGLWGPR